MAGLSDTPLGLVALALGLPFGGPLVHTCHDIELSALVLHCSHLTGSLRRDLASASSLQDPCTGNDFCTPKQIIIFSFGEQVSTGPKARKERTYRL